DLNMQLGDIMQNVQWIINRYTMDENVHSGRKISLTEHKKWRASLLEKIVTCAKTAEIKEKTLVYILAWLEEWNVILSEMTTIDIDEHHHCIAQMEMLPETLKAIESNVKLLSRISTSLLEEKKKQKKKTASRGSLWKSWKERVIKRPATAHVLRPDQMISDQFATNTKVSEIQDMLQELIGTAVFNKLENNAIKYMSSTIVNLSKALSTLNDEVKVINLQSANMYTNETSEKKKEISLKIIKDLSKKNEMLQQKLQEAEEKYEHLIRSKGVDHQALPTSTLRVLPEPSPQLVISQADTEDSVDNILAKEFEIVVDEAPPKGTKALGIKWDSSPSYTAQGETIPDITDQQYPLPEKKQKKASEEITEDIITDKISAKKGGAFHKDGTDQYQSQKGKCTKGPYVQETSESNVNDDKGKQKVSGTKLDHHFELQALEKKRKEIKSFSEGKSKSLTESKSQHFPSDFPSDTKSQGGKSGTSSIWERLRKAKPEYSHSKSQISSENKEELTTESMDEEGRSEMSSQAEPSRLSQLDYSSEKMKIKGKKHQIAPGTIISKEEKTEEKDMSVFAKKVKSLELVKSQSRITKEISGIPDGKREQSNLEEFQKAIVSFLKEKIDNIRKPLDKKTRAEVEKLRIIKAKMEEYFQKVAETVTKILRKYKDIKNAGQIGEKPMKLKKVVSFMPELHFQKQITAKSEISTLLSQESLDPLTDNLIQMILAEIESERDVPVASMVGKDHKEKEKQRLEERSYEMINKNLEKEEAWLPMKEGKQGQQKQKQWQEEEVWKGHQKQRLQKQIEPDEKQKKREEEKEGHQKSKQQQLEAWKQKMKEQGVPLEKEKGQQMMQVQKEVRYLEQESSWEREEEKQKPRRKVEDHERQKQKTAKEMKTSEQLEQVLSHTSVTLPSRWHSTPKDALQLHQRREFNGNLKKFENLADEKHPIPIIPPISTQSSSPGAFSISGQSPTKSITLTPQQAQAMEIDLTPEEAKALGITPTSHQGLGAAHTPEQAQALRVTLTPQQVQALGTHVTAQQTQALGITLTPQQAQALGIHVTPQQAQDLGAPFTLGQAQALGVSLSPEQFEELGVPPTSDNNYTLDSPHIPEQTQPLGATFTPGQAQSMGITLRSEQDLKLGALLINEQPLPLRAGPPSGHTLAVGIFSITDKSVTTRAPHIPKQSPVSSAPVAEKSPIFEVSSTPLQISRSPLTQAPFVPGKSLGMRIPSEPRKLLASQTFPSSRQTPVSKGQSTSVRFPTPVPSPISGPSPTPGQPLAPEALLSSRQFCISRDVVTPQLPLISKPLLDSRQPLISGVPATSTQISSIWAPFSPGKCLVPGVSSTPEELLESGPLTLSEQPQAFQTSATHEQSPYLQAPSTLRQHLSSWALPGQASPLWIPPTPGHAPTLWAPSTPGKPQKNLSSPVSKKSKERLSIISSLKPKSALVHPSAPSFKVPQAPFTTKKFQISEVSDTYEEIQRPRDPFAMEQFRTFKTPVSQTPYTDEGALPTLIKPVISLPSLTTQLCKTSQSSPSEWDQKSRFPRIDKPWILTSLSGTKKPKMMVPTSYPQELKEQNYFVDVEAQRKNLILLNQATKASTLPSQLHTTARNLIIETLHTDKVRLGYLFRKYIAYRLIQCARKNIIKWLQAIQNTGRGYETQNLYIMLSRIDDYQKKVMQICTEKQKSLQQKQNQCLRKMMYLFSQLQEIYKLNLNQAIPLILKKKQISASTKFVQQPILKEEDKKYDIFSKFRYVVGKTDIKLSLDNMWDLMLFFPAQELPLLHSYDMLPNNREDINVFTLGPAGWVPRYSYAAPVRCSVYVQKISYMRSLKHQGVTKSSFLV
ncbi:hypothetical protein E2I00_001251, partial [Balaenoptera physalus]